MALIMAIGGKAPPQDPLCVVLLGEILRDGGYPRGGVNVVQCSVDDAAPLLEDPRVRMITFTGSAPADWPIPQDAARHHAVVGVGRLVAQVNADGLGEGIVQAVLRRLVRLARSALRAGRAGSADGCGHGGRTGLRGRPLLRTAPLWRGAAREAR